MGKKKEKVKKKCCKKYLKEGKHCKSCPLYVKEDVKKKVKDTKKKEKKKKKDKKKVLKKPIKYSTKTVI